MIALAESMARTLTFTPSVKDIARLTQLKNTLQTFPDPMNETADFIE
jgi:hypothetical protein